MKEELRPRGTARRGRARAGRGPRSGAQSAARVGARRRHDEDARGAASRRRPPQLEEPPEHTEVGRFDMERAARLGLALRLLDRRHGAACVRALPARARPARKGFTPVLPPVLVREEAMYGTGFFPTDARTSTRSIRRSLPDRHLRGRARRAAHGRDPRRAAAALRRLLDVLPPRGGRRRQGHPRHVPRAPVQQGRALRLLRPEDSGAEHERLLEIEESLVRALGLPYRV